VDLYPTLCDWCDLPSEVGPHPLDGHSFAPLVENPDGPWDGPDVAVSAVASDTAVDAAHPGPARDQHWTVRSASHRYIRYHDGSEELYDHRNDPYEWTNIAADDPETCKLLKAALVEQVPALA
jgi:arylsulfatase A-like enzyme